MKRRLLSAIRMVGGRFSHHAGMTECCSCVGKIWKEVLSVRESFIGPLFHSDHMRWSLTACTEKKTTDYKKPSKPYPTGFSVQTTGTFLSGFSCYRYAGIDKFLF